ncbi:MAG TPA: hypothetical protein DCM41_04585 [Synergistaceae bacterium]|nr:hypothetical protein [Synergistaceae bacterium]
MKVDRAMTKKRPGAALLAIVLVGFLVLSLVSAVVVTIAWNTLRVEAWQTEQIEKTRLDYLARTAAQAVTEELIADPEAFGILNRNGLVSQPKVITDGAFSATVEITIKGDDQRANVVAKASSVKGGSALVRTTINLTTTPKTVTWSAGN